MVLIIPGEGNSSDFLQTSVEDKYVLPVPLLLNTDPDRRREKVGRGFLYSDSESVSGSPEKESEEGRATVQCSCGVDGVRRSTPQALPLLIIKLVPERLTKSELLFSLLGAETG